MKQIVYIIVDNGIDGRSPDSIVYASTNELERDNFYIKSPNKNWYTRKEIIANLDDVAIKTWKKLNALEKLSLERVDCVLWKDKPQSIYSL
jgi:hypothetical protein